MEWEVLFDEEFAEWLDTLGVGFASPDRRSRRVAGAIRSEPGRPRVDTVKGFVFANMKELRVQYEGQPWRILFAFDPQRSAILLVGGNKGGDRRWYEEQIRIADRRFRRHLDSLEPEEED